MGLLDKLRGSRPAAPGTTPQPASTVRAALLAVGQGDVAWTVVDGAPDMDVIATLDQGGTGGRHDPEIVFRTFMRLDEAAHEVQAIDEMRVRGRGQYKLMRGNVASRRFRRTYRRGPEGYALAEEERSSSGDLKDALRDAVTSNGWAWSVRLVRKP